MFRIPLCLLFIILKLLGENPGFAIATEVKHIKNLVKRTSTIVKKSDNEKNNITILNTENKQHSQ